ncbi:hypothetical protein [Kribbella sp. VKM Ac-2568]|uniref:hypothetical protein n=1 Tax=Kribbella sp. VKM Ac-2568 TaxID=2512219 RepID=UPI001052E426|nr:hypothetical protein [Kribbella sp. VKM Ac-2568]TCM38281.1 hypothetical protein EV648_117153 [Kribbella sp. VKM Ac-2568]
MRAKKDPAAGVVLVAAAAAVLVHQQAEAAPEHPMVDHSTMNHGQAPDATEAAAMARLQATPVPW